MKNSENVWPSEEELNNIGNSVDLAPYGVISQYSAAIYSAYNKELVGIVTARYNIKTNGDKTNFVYSLLISQTKNDGAQVKIFEIEIQDDGWYPATVSLIKPAREELGIAETEEQLRTFIENGIKSDFVKAQIKSLLNK